MPETPVESLVQTAPQRKPVARLRRSFGYRLWQSVRLRAKDSFGREQIVASLKTLAWVAPMTILIWVYAEREQTSKQPVQFHIEARNNDPKRVVELRGPGADGRLSTNFIVRADLGGPNAHLDQAKQKLEGGGGLQVDIPDNLEPGNHQIPLMSLLANDPTFEKEGLTPSNVLPAQVDVYIDPIENQTAEIVVRPSVKNLDGPVHYQPSTISITCPRSTFNAIVKDTGRLIVYGELPNSTEPGAKHVENVPLTPPVNDSHVHVPPISVTATYVIKSPLAEGTLPGVTVLASYPRGEPWDKYVPQNDPTIPFVKVIGPPDVIEDVRRPDYPDPPRAFLDLTHVDPAPGRNPVAGQQYKAPLIYDFGNTGLKQSPDAPTSLTFTIVPRSGG